VRNPLPAAQVDALRVDILHALPGLRLGLEDGVVVRRRDPGVVVEDIDAAVALDRRVIHGADAGGVRDIGLDRERFARFRNRPLGRSEVDVRDTDLRTLLGEEQRRLAPHSASRTGDDGDLALEPAAQRLSFR